MSSFAIRNSYHDEFVAEIAAALKRNNWNVEPYGQENYPAGLRQLLANQTALDRWRPDLIAERQGRFRLVDGKTCTERNKMSANYAIEKASLSAHEQAWGWPVLIVFHDWQVVPAKLIWELVDRDQLRAMPWNGYGSGTPAWLLPKQTTCLIDFDGVFA